MYTVRKPNMVIKAITIMLTMMTIMIANDYDDDNDDDNDDHSDDDIDNDDDTMLLKTMIAMIIVIIHYKRYQLKGVAKD